MNRPLIGFGHLHHARTRPKLHRFSYGTCFLMLPLRSMHREGSGALAHNRRGLVSFFDADHGDGGSNALLWLDALLLREGIVDAIGEVWLHCFPRMLGCAFKPVSFWYCHDADGALRAIVVEVNNTFGERHCYLLDRPAYGVELRATKVFHVSPFCRVAGTYRFCFRINAGRTQTCVSIDHDDEAGLLLATRVSGTLLPANAASIRKALWSFPLMTLAVVARIHWHAALLGLKRVRFHTKPPAPEHFVTRH